MDKSTSIYKDLSGLIDELNSESTKIAERNAGNDIAPRKAGVFFMLPVDFIRHFLFKGGYYNFAERFYTSVFSTLLRFTSSIKTLKLLNRL